MAQSNLNDVLSLFPPDSWVRPLVGNLFSDDPEQRDKAYNRLERSQRRTLTEPDGEAILAAVARLNFPPLKCSWKNSPGCLVQLLWEKPSEKWIPAAQNAYPTARDICGAALLVVMAATKTRAGATAFVDCVRQYGWPEDMYDRVFTQLHGLLDHCDVLFPALIELEGGWLNHFGDVVIEARSSGKLTDSALRGVESYIASQLEEAYRRAAGFQRARGIAWRFDEAYRGVRFRLAFLLDLAGWMSPSIFQPMLRRAMSLEDPRLLMFAAASLLRHGCDVDQSVLDRVAACHEMRAPFFQHLQAMEQSARFPKRWRTWNAFAAADMVQWLCYPTELGREPDELEKMSIFEGRSADGPNALYVWRFKDKHGKWLAATSGPYLLVGQPVPCSGGSTFSSFEPWESATAEEHAASVLETLDGVFREHEEDDR